MAPSALAIEEPAVVAIFNVSLIGHLNPTFPLVQELVGRGCRVHYFLPPDENAREAARQAGATVESYMKGDPQDYRLDNRGCEAAESMPEEFRQAYAYSVSPLVSALECAEHVIGRCRELAVSIVLHDPLGAHGLLVAKALGLPNVSLVTYPGFGSLSTLLGNQELLEQLKALRQPLGAQVREQLGVDLEDQLLTRVQYLSEESLVTTSEELMAPLPPRGEQPWADELRERFQFRTVGCMVDEHAPHIASAKKPQATSKQASLGSDLPVQQLEDAKARGAKVIFVALGTMALSDRWSQDLGVQSAGNVPEGVTGKLFCQHVWAQLFDAMRALGDGYHCVLSVGNQEDALDFLAGEGDAALQQVLRNVTIRSFVPQVTMLNQYADAFVSHAGFNSMQESLMAGVPLIAVPQAVDQPANAQKIEASAWGRAFLKPMATLTAASLASAVQEVCADGSPYQAAVASEKEKLQGGHRRAADRVLQLAAARRAALARGGC